MISPDLVVPAAARAPRRPWWAAMLLLSGAWIVALLTTWLLGAAVLHADGGVIPARIDQPFEAWLRTAGQGLRPLADRVTVLGAWPAAAIGGAVAVVAAARRGLARGLAIAVACVGAEALTAVAKLLVHRLGPTQRAASGIQDYAFPSGHATTAAALGVGAALVLTIDCRPRTRFLALGAAFAVAVAVAISRLVLDVHWLTDVIAGVGVGAAWAWLSAAVLAGAADSPQLARAGSQASGLASAERS